MIYSILTKIKIIAAAAIYIESGDLNPKAFFFVHFTIFACSKC